MKNYNHYINRELSWLKFNQRVLHEVLDDSRNVIECLKFSAIFSNNLDEFFMVRVGGLVEQIKFGYNKRDIAGLKPKKQLKFIREKVLELIDLQSELTMSLFDNELADVGIKLLDINALSTEQLQFIERYFEEQIYPVLTPMAIDLNRPFPLVLNKSLNILFKFESEEDKYATLQVPSVLSRLIAVDENKLEFVFLEDVIKYFSHILFEGLNIEYKGLYRPTRNADISLNEEVAEDLLAVIEQSLNERKRGEVVRLEVEEDMPAELLNYLVKTFDAENNMVYFIKGRIDFTFLFMLDAYKCECVQCFEHIPKKVDFDEATIFDAIKQRDYLLHHPYQSFDPVVELIDKASMDDDVLAIKQVLYRVSGDSPIVSALSRAASRGKQVTVVLELMARFDEENNINWAKELEKHGCHVIFGLRGMKTHAKITLIVRREMGTIKRYLHLGSGNYNDKTAKLYTDVGLMTCDEQLAADASKFFNVLSGYTKQSELNELVSAPDFLKTELINRIKREIYWTNQGSKGKIVAKFNALVEEDVINTLYEASQAGVKITLIIRGICCLVPGVKGLSENIKIISIIDDFLEHSRIFWFLNNGKNSLFISSADWMSRNLVRRVELMTPVKDEALKDELMNILNIYASTTPKSREMLANGEYISRIGHNQTKSAQKILAEDYY